MHLLHCLSVQEWELPILSFLCYKQCYQSVFLFLKYLADISPIKSAIGKHLF